MSRRERFFNSSSLLRIAKHVEWEPDLEKYPDGTTNQGRFMEAIGLLYGEWLSMEQLPEAVAQARDVLADDWVAAFQHVIEKIPAKVEQVVGFWSGLLRLRKERSLFGPLIGPEDIGQLPEGLSDIEDRTWLICDALISQLRSILREE